MKKIEVNLEINSPKKESFTASGLHRDHQPVWKLLFFSSDFNPLTVSIWKCDVSKRNSNLGGFYWS